MMGGRFEAAVWVGEVEGDGGGVVSSIEDTASARQVLDGDTHYNAHGVRWQGT